MIRKIIPILALVPLLFCGCLDDEDYITDASTALVVHRDTVDLGVTLADELSVTDTLKFFNNSSKALRISQAWLESGASSPFRVNLDGTYLENGAATSFEVASKDSLLAFIAFNAPESDSNDAVEFTDRLYVRTEGGAETSVVLVGSSQNVVRIVGETLTESTTYTADRPYQIIDSLVVAAGATLTLDAGTTLLFHAGASLIVRGTLVSDGTAEQNVVLRCDKLGNMLTDIAYDDLPGQWGGVRIASDSYGNTLAYTDIHGGSFGIVCDSASTATQKLDMEGCIIHNVTGYALWAKRCRIDATNCQITNAGADCVCLFGGNSSFVHCTVAQFYPLTSGDGVALNFANYDGDVAHPLEVLQFYNSIITGRNEDDLMGSPSADFSDVAFNYYFKNCLINTPNPADEEHFPGCLWEEDADDDSEKSGNFRSFDYDHLLFDFQLDSISRAIGAADASVSTNYAPTDRLGVSRAGKSATDMGCYEYVGE